VFYNAASRTLPDVLLSLLKPESEMCFPQPAVNTVPPCVSEVYKIMRKTAGQISGYCIPGGETYGELTMHSLQVCIA
jgi:hypothetical protein